MKWLEITGVGLRIEMKDNETQEQAEERLLDMLKENGIRCLIWMKSEVKEKKIK